MFETGSKDFGKPTSERFLGNRLRHPTNLYLRQSQRVKEVDISKRHPVAPKSHSAVSTTTYRSRPRGEGRGVGHGHGTALCTVLPRRLDGVFVGFRRVLVGDFMGVFTGVSTGICAKNDLFLACPEMSA